MIDAFLLALRARNLSQRTLDYYAWQLGKFAAWLGGRSVVNVAAITATDVREYLVSLQERGLAAASQHAAARAARAWLNFLVAEGVLERSPMASVKMPKRGKHILPAFTAEEVQALLAACDKGRGVRPWDHIRLRAVVLVLLDTGLRASEFCGLRMRDVTLSSGRVFVRSGKGNKDRITWLEATAKAALVRYIESERGGAGPDDPLFVSRETGGALTTAALLTLLNRLGVRAGVHCHPHKFRRSCAIFMHRNDARLTDIAELLGHSDLATLKKYLDLNAQDGRAAHRAHSPVERLLG